ncbi:cholera enterotoxin subunit A2 [Colletotrichum navitas]|uniref:Cholera enterotoxin subunit A2 n=1 Tax=Colletotrichum navitas TaxID=681940 RepID=A0AAD8Q7I7_9PEZI|nr:cholera enterotoxin subunit A2 [Colletotrichum navitas]KAK1597114.1 cholera enterotoxin subunit A2 [Colletotrichum navitas]
MGMRQNLFVLFNLVSLCVFSGEAAFLRSDPKFVWRGAGRSPQEIKAAGGFVPKGLTAVGEVAPSISLWNHVDIPEEYDEEGNRIGLGSTRDDDGYTSFTSSFLLALGHAFFSRQQETTWIYRVKTTPNMIDVTKTLGKYNVYFEEDEYAALGGVKWDQIVSWRKIDRSNLQSFSWLLPIKNPDYNEIRYSGFRTGGAQYGLAGFPPNHKAWWEDPWKQFRPCSAEQGTVRVQNPM